MQVTKVALTPQGDPACSPATICQSTVKVDVTLTGLGDASWISPVVVKQGADGVWALDPSPSTIHPDLTDSNRIRRVRALPARAPILDRNGRKLAWSQPIVRVGLEAGKADAAAAKKLAGIVGTNGTALAKTLAGTAKGRFAEAIVLRKAEYAAVAKRVAVVKGITVEDDVRALAPAAAFARGVLGTVAPATKETLANAGDTASASDEVGSFGLQFAFQKQLAGTATTAVRIVHTATGKVVTTIASTKGTPGKPLTTTMDYTVQAAAEKAVAQSTGHNASMVVVQPSTGQILAVANGPGSRNDNPAMSGHYAPGSTFKIVTSSALMKAGLTADSKVPCTRSLNVDGRTFVNYDALPVTGTMTLRRAFELSCNTAFISQREKVPGSALHDMASMYGLGSTAWDLPVERVQRQRARTHHRDGAGREHDRPGPHHRQPARDGRGRGRGEERRDERVHPDQGRVAGLGDTAAEHDGHGTAFDDALDGHQRHRIGPRRSGRRRRQDRDRRDRDQDQCVDGRVPR